MADRKVLLSSYRLDAVESMNEKRLVLAGAACLGFVLLASAVATICSLRSSSHRFLQWPATRIYAAIFYVLAFATAGTELGGMMVLDPYICKPETVAAISIEQIMRLALVGLFVSWALARSSSRLITLTLLSFMLYRAGLALALVVTIMPTATHNCIITFQPILFAVTLGSEVALSVVVFQASIVDAIRHWRKRRDPEVFVHLRSAVAMCIVAPAAVVFQGSAILGFFDETHGELAHIVSRGTLTVLILTLALLLSPLCGTDCPQSPFDAQEGAARPPASNNGGSDGTGAGPTTTTRGGSDPEKALRTGSQLDTLQQQLPQKPLTADSQGGYEAAIPAAKRGPARNADAAVQQRELAASNEGAFVSRADQRYVYSLSLAPGSTVAAAQLRRGTESMHTAPPAASYLPAHVIAASPTRSVEAPSDDGMSFIIGDGGLITPIDAKRLSFGGGSNLPGVLPGMYGYRTLPKSPDLTQPLYMHARSPSLADVAEHLSDGASLTLTAEDLYSLYPTAADLHPAEAAAATAEEDDAKSPSLPSLYHSDGLRSSRASHDDLAAFEQSLTRPERASAQVRVVKSLADVFPTPPTKAAPTKPTRPARPTDQAHRSIVAPIVVGARF